MRNYKLILGFVLLVLAVTSLSSVNNPKVFKLLTTESLIRFSIR